VTQDRQFVVVVAEAGAEQSVLMGKLMTGRDGLQLTSCSLVIWHAWLQEIQSCAIVFLCGISEKTLKIHCILSYKCISVLL